MRASRKKLDFIGNLGRHFFSSVSRTAYRTIVENQKEREKRKTIERLVSHWLVRGTFVCSGEGFGEISKGLSKFSVLVVVSQTGI